jgi:hypothetical protein
LPRAAATPVSARPGVSAAHEPDHDPFVADTVPIEVADVGV